MSDVTPTVIITAWDVLRTSGDQALLKRWLDELERRADDIPLPHADAHSGPGRQHVVITGRDAPQALIDAADLVTEMACVKHPMDAGRKGQPGIEW